jgi:hypothetical protein
MMPSVTAEVTPVIRHLDDHEPEASARREVRVVEVVVGHRR